MSYLLSPVSPAMNDFPDVQSKWKERNDRQLRLWGVHGQDRIDNAHVCLLNASAVGSEVLKNIVLPGFSKFAIVDGNVVKPRDLGVNFFIPKEGLGQSRAEIVTTTLAELNPDVTGSFLNRDPVEVLTNAPEFFDQFNMIVATDLTLSATKKFAKYCSEKNKVFVIVKSYGMLGYIRVQSNSHEIVESKLDQEVDDLRLSCPWPELDHFCSLQDIDKMDDNKQSHTPYPVILIRLAKEFKQTHGHLPQTREEREKFLQFIHSRTPSFFHTNYQEAADKYFQAFNLPEIPMEVQQIFQDDLCKNLTSESSDFWIMSAALKKFVENEGEGKLPVPGKLPDMHSDTDRYIKLQSIYRKKARSDMAIVKRYVDELLVSVGKKENAISEMDIKEFCKNSASLRVFHFRSIEQELDNPNKEELKMQLMFNPDSTIPWYIMLRAADIYQERNGAYPGSSGVVEYGEETSKLMQVVKELIGELDLADVDNVEWEKYAAEMVRFGAAELHNISSLVGGVGGQELIKLCTKQRLVLNNTLVYNGIDGKSSAFVA